MLFSTQIFPELAAVETRRFWTVGKARAGLRSVENSCTDRRDCGVLNAVTASCSPMTKSKIISRTRTRARREEDKGKRRELILNAAEKVFAKLGLKGANFGAVAKQSRLSRSLIYVYFPKRSDLIHAVCERGLLALQTRLASVAVGSAKGIDQVIAMARAYHVFSKEEPLYFSVIAELETYPIPLPDQNEIERELTDCGKQVLGLVALAVGKGLEDGSVCPDCGDPMLSAVSIWAFTHGIIQVSTSKACMLEDDLGVTANDAMEHGFRMLRHSLTCGKRA